MADRLWRQIQEITLGLEDPIFTLPLGLCHEAIYTTRFSLIAKPVNPRKQNLRAMMQSLVRLWGPGDDIVGRLIEDKQIQFLFSSEDLLLSILRRGPWSFNDWMCVIQQWHPNLGIEEMNQIPFWVQIRGIPIQYLSLAMVTTIGDEIGHFLETDFDGVGANQAASSSKPPDSDDENDSDGDDQNRDDADVSLSDPQIAVPLQMVPPGPDVNIATMDTQTSSSKKRKTDSQQSGPDAPSSSTPTGDPSPQQTDRDGTVDQKPPEGP